MFDFSHAAEDTVDGRHQAKSYHAKQTDSAKNAFHGALHFEKQGKEKKEPGDDKYLDKQARCLFCGDAKGRDFGEVVSFSGKAAMEIILVIENLYFLYGAEYLVDGFDDLGFNEVYLRRGSPPTAGEYDARSTNQGGADQTVFVPDAGAGPWYILIIESEVTGTGEYAIQTEVSTGVVLLGLTPYRLGI